MSRRPPTPLSNGEVANKGLGRFFKLKLELSVFIPPFFSCARRERREVGRQKFCGADAGEGGGGARGEMKRDGGGRGDRHGGASVLTSFFMVFCFLSIPPVGGFAVDGFMEIKHGEKSSQWVRLRHPERSHRLQEASNASFACR